MVLKVRQILQENIFCMELVVVFFFFFFLERLYKYCRSGTYNYPFKSL